MSKTSHIQRLRASQKRWEHGALALIVALYLALAIAYAWATPRWQNPDEPAHYNYAREIVDHGRLPVLRPGDYNQQKLQRLLNSKWAGDHDISAIRYESYQPPLYYAIGALALAAVPGQDLDLYALRFVSILCGALVLVVIFAIGRELFTEDLSVALAATALVAFIPQHLAMMAAANNDALSELVLSATVLLSIRRIKGLSDRTFTISAAVLLACALLTKLTTYTGIVILVAAEVGRWWLARREGGRLNLVPLGLALLGALALSGWWFARNAVAYSGADILGLARHNAVVVGQPRTVWGVPAVRYLIITTFQSFWAVFGWMNVLVDARIYWLLALLSSLALVGLLIFLLRSASALFAWQRLALAVLGLQFALIAGILVMYNLTFIQAQGRYLFPASAAIGIFSALGLRELLHRPLWLAALTAAGCMVLFAIRGGRRFVAIGAALAVAIVAVWRAMGGSYQWVLWAGLVSALVVLDVICLVVYIVPALR